MTTIIQFVISVFCMSYAFYILDAEIIKYHKAWEALDAEDRPAEEPLKRLSPKVIILFAFVGIILGILPVVKHWSWLVPAAAIVALEILLFTVVEYKQHRETLFWYVLQFATSVAFCIVGKVNFEVVTYVFFAFVAIFICDYVKRELLKEGSESDD